MEPFMNEADAESKEESKSGKSELRLHNRKYRAM